MQRKVFLFGHKEIAWRSFLEEYFEDTASPLEFFYEAAKFRAYLDTGEANMGFIQSEVLTPVLIPKLRFLRETKPGFYFFHLGELSLPGTGLAFDAVLREPVQLLSFQKQLM